MDANGIKTQILYEMIMKISYILKYIKIAEFDNFNCNRCFCSFLMVCFFFSEISAAAGRCWHHQVKI